MGVVDTFGLSDQRPLILFILQTSINKIYTLACTNPIFMSVHFHKISIKCSTKRLFMKMQAAKNEFAKGQLISKANCQAVRILPKNERMNSFFTKMRRVFVRFLEEIELNKKTF